MANEGIFLALGGLFLLSLFRRPGTDAPGAGSAVDWYAGGGSVGDFAADATLRAEEATGPDGRVTTNLTVVPTLEPGSNGGYVKTKEKLPPTESRRDEDIGTNGIFDAASRPKEIVTGAGNVPVIDQDPRLLPGPLVPAIPEILGRAPLQAPVTILLDYSEDPGIIDVTTAGGMPAVVDALTPLRLTQRVTSKGIIRPAGFGVNWDQGFVARTADTWQAAVAGFDSVREYQEALAVGGA